VLVVYSVGRVQCWSCTVLVVYSVGRVQCWSCTELIVYSVGRVQCWSCTVLVVYSVGHVQCWSCTVLVVYSVGRVQCWSSKGISFVHAGILHHGHIYLIHTFTFMQKKETYAAATGIKRQVKICRYGTCIGGTREKRGH
jgi:hypothetical protein